MRIGIILGTGWTTSVLSAGITDFRHDKTMWMTTPYGEPSSSIRLFKGEMHQLLVLMRHGERQSTPAHEIPHAANACVMAELAPDWVLCLGTAGTLSSKIKVGELGRISEYSTHYSPDTTEGYDLGSRQNRNTSNINLTWPPLLPGINIRFTDQIRYVQIRGPEAATSIDVKYYQDMGFDAIGMTLAREDFQLWHLRLLTVPICFITDSCGRTTESAQWMKLVENGSKIINRLITAHMRLNNEFQTV